MPQVSAGKYIERIMSCGIYNIKRFILSHEFASKEDIISLSFPIKFKWRLISRIYTDWQPNCTLSKKEELVLLLLILTEEKDR